MLLQRISAACLALFAYALADISNEAHGQATARAKLGLRSAHVYMFHGFMGVSPGLDSVAGKIAQRGIPVRIASHVAASEFAQDAIKKYKTEGLRSIVIIGHSMGGGAAIDMATRLGAAGIPVKLVVTLDLVGTSTAPKNVQRLINYYVPGGMGALVSRSSDARGNIQNIRESRPDVGHISIVVAHERELLSQVFGAL
jgi:pimeloyl-ACP methyl ester carboxylesterase